MLACAHRLCPAPLLASQLEATFASQLFKCFSLIIILLGEGWLGPGSRILRRIDHETAGDSQMVLWITTSDLRILKRYQSKLSCGISDSPSRVDTWQMSSQNNERWSWTSSSTFYHQHWASTANSEMNVIQSKSMQIYHNIFLCIVCCYDPPPNHHLLLHPRPLFILLNKIETKESTKTFCTSDICLL